MSSEVCTISIPSIGVHFFKVSLSLGRIQHFLFHRYPLLLGGHGIRMGGHGIRSHDQQWKSNPKLFDLEIDTVEIDTITHIFLAVYLQ